MPCAARPGRKPACASAASPTIRATVAVPNTLMIGCFGEALDEAIFPDRNELEDCRWFTRAEVRAMLDGTHAEGFSSPKPIAIAYHLVKTFVDET